MHKKSWAIATIILILLSTACNSLKSGERMTHFDETFRLYAKHLRWGQFTQVSSFLTEDHIAHSLAIIPSLKNIRVTHVTPLNWIANQEKDTIRGTVTIDYYITNRGVVKQTRQAQTWRWQETGWKLDADLPELP